MSRPEEIARRRSGEEVNCRVAFTSSRTGAGAEADAHIPVFAGTGIAALILTDETLRPGDVLRRREDGRSFRVVDSLAKTSVGCRVALERV